MRKLDALEALAQLAVARTTEGDGALSEATRIVGAVIGSDDVRLFVGDGVNFHAYPQTEEEDFFGLSPEGLLSADQELRKLGHAVVFKVGHDRQPRLLAPTDGRRAGTYVASGLWTGQTYGGTVVARGPWTAAAARRAGRFLESAGPALATTLELVADADRTERLQQQMNALADVARIFTRAQSMREVVREIVSAINSATSFLCSLDLLDRRGRIAMRSTAASRFTGTPLYEAYLRLVRAPDPVRSMIVKTRQPVVLPDLQNDPRISEEAREFYRRASLVSAATLPLLFQDEVVGLLRVGSLKPTPFDPPTVELLRNLALQAAVVVKGAQLWRELQRSRKKLESRNQELLNEISERQRAEEALRHQAATDGLTGLLNHRSLYEALAKETESSLAGGWPTAVLMMDMDGFKLFNDTYGHQEGDRVLRQVARLLERELRANDILGRYGGDEFMVIMPGTDRTDAVSCANRIIEALSKERVQPREGHELPLTASIGLALCPDDSRHKEELLAHADASLLEAKQLTGGNLVVAQHGPDDLLARRRTPFGVLDALVRAVDRKDSYTRHHSQQNAEFAVELGKAVGLSGGAVDALRIGGLLHDVGKIGVPDDVLKKPGPLTDEEQTMMQEHVVLSNLIVHGVPNLHDVSDAVYSHHERWDGTGYPRGLKGEEIPLAGRIMALVDAYSAMILDRPYRKALSKEQAVAELRKNAGSQFDPALVEPFIGLLESREKAAA